MVGKFVMNFLVAVDHGTFMLKLHMRVLATREAFFALTLKETRHPAPSLIQARVAPVVDARYFMRIHNE